MLGKVPNTPPQITKEFSTEVVYYSGIGNFVHLITKEFSAMVVTCYGSIRNMLTIPEDLFGYASFVKASWPGLLPTKEKKGNYLNGLIRTHFTLGELVSLVKVFRLFRLEWIFLVFRVWTW
jgi:hypothetical protein